jgi:bifunctional non-homologous end joining protein LigD
MPGDDRPTLELDARLPAPPTDLRPMLARPSDHLPIGADRLADPTWGGLRVMARLDGRSVGLLTDDHDVARRFPDIAAGLAALELSSTVLDGEIVVPGARSRVLASAVRRGHGAIGPATLVISDLPWTAGRSLLATSLDQRRERLAGLGVAGRGLVVLQPAVGSQGVAEAVVLRGLLGIILKRADSPYLPGVRSRLWTLVRVADLGRRPPAEGATAGGQPDGRTDIALLRTLALVEDGR